MDNDQSRERQPEEVRPDDDAPVNMTPGGNLGEGPPPPQGQQPPTILTAVATDNLATPERMEHIPGESVDSTLDADTRTLSMSLGTSTPTDKKMVASENESSPPTKIRKVDHQNQPEVTEIPPQPPRAATPVTIDRPPEASTSKAPKPPQQANINPGSPPYSSRHPPKLNLLLSPNSISADYQVILNVLGIAPPAPALEQGPPPFICPPPPPNSPTVGPFPRKAVVPSTSFLKIQRENAGGMLSPSPSPSPQQAIGNIRQDGGAVAGGSTSSSASAPRPPAPQDSSEDLKKQIETLNRRLNDLTEMNEDLRDRNNGLMRVNGSLRYRIGVVMRENEYLRRRRQEYNFGGFDYFGGGGGGGSSQDEDEDEEMMMGEDGLFGGRGPVAPRRMYSLPDLLDMEGGGLPRDMPGGFQMGGVEVGGEGAEEDVGMEQLGFQMENSPPAGRNMDGGYAFQYGGSEDGGDQEVPYFQPCGFEEGIAGGEAEVVEEEDIAGAGMVINNNLGEGQNDKPEGSAGEDEWDDEREDYQQMND